MTPDWSFGTTTMIEQRRDQCSRCDSYDPGTGECRAEPPKANNSWPKVDPGDWCACWERRR